MLVRFYHVARFIVNADHKRSGLQTHIGDGKRFVVDADEKLTAFLELEATISGDERRTQFLRNRA